MLRDDVGHQHFPAGGGRSDHIGAGLDLVGNDGIGAPVQGVDTVDLDGIRARAADVRTHGVQEVGKVHDMRLTRGVFDHRAAFGKNAGNHDVHRRADRDLVQIDPRAVKPAVLRIGIDITAADIDLGTEGTHALDMLVNRPNAEVAAAGHGRLGTAEAAKHGADQVI